MAVLGMQERPSRVKLILAFAAVYIIWGSTYLAIRYAIETLPPLLMAGGRFLTAGTVLYLWARAQGASRPALREWRPATIIGGLLLLGGNGMVVLAERDVPSGLAALLIATEPMMVVLLDWLRPGGDRPAGKTVLGLTLGFVGMLLLIGPSGLAGESGVAPLGATLLIAATVSWAAGSLYAAKRKLVDSPVMAAAMQMLAGGTLLLLAGLITGEAAGFAVAEVSLRSLAAFFYLIVFGSLIAFTSYSWILRVTPPSIASTYAYVNPVVAVLLGWALAGEPLTVRTLLAAAVIIAAVALITTNRGHSGSQGEAESKSRRKLFNPFAPKLPRRYVETGD
ncbi:MAG TPA: drug/metabolite exporter YedA [Blastocatellia bacterium]|nr:drug/metabolite exporter YedA [Blastocatellia bacterium]